MNATEQSKPTRSTKKPRVFKSDRSWAGKVIQTGERAETKVATRSFTSARYETHWNDEEKCQEGVCFRDGVEVARSTIPQDRKNPIT